MDWNKYTISKSSCVLDVLKRIDRIPELQTVFIKDEKEKIIGTITDGDIRRGLICGLSIDSNLENFIHRDFLFIEQGKNNFGKLKAFRDRKLKAIPLLNSRMQLVKIIDFTKAKSILPVDAVLMAGGKGERLKPLTEETPKPLLKVGNKEIISYNFDRLLQFGITRQYVTVNYLADQIENYCKTYDQNIFFRIIKEGGYLGTAGALSLINDFHNETILLMNSDLLTNIDYEDFYLSYVEKNADLMVASIPYEINLPYAIFETNEREVISFKEKPSYLYFANAGLYLMKKEVVNLIPPETVFNATDLMEKLIRTGKKVIHYPIRSYWLDIGKPIDFERAQKDILHIKWD